MQKNMIELAIEVTTQGDPVPNEYRIASWLNGQDIIVPASEIREALGVAGNQIDPEIVSGIGNILRDEQAREAGA